jgi:hypothetical protein
MSYSARLMSPDPLRDWGKEVSIRNVEQRNIVYSASLKIAIPDHQVTKSQVASVNG